MTDRPATTSPPDTRPRRFRPAALILPAVLILAVLGVAFVQYQLSPIDPNAQAKEFEVLPGWGASRVSHELENEGFIRNAEFFSLYLRLQELDRSIGEGLYDLSEAMSLPEIARRLEAGGRPRVTQVVIPEGFRTQDIAARLEEAGFADAATFMALIEAPGELRPAYLPQDATLEGYLFPASYDIPVESSPEEILKTMLARFEQEITSNTLEALEARGLSVHDWVTLASMVQSEAGNADEMPIIAGVFLNRLDRGMLLQSDPTVAYGLGKELQELNAFAGDFTEAADHPWNTYTRPGLPWGPISNPGHAALQAVLAPQRSNAEGQPYLYFLHSRDGTVFRPNLSLEEHVEDVQEYLR